MAHTPSFAEIYGAAREGDAAARETLILRFQHRILRHVRRVMGLRLRRHLEVEDVVQTVTLAFLDRLSTFPEDLGEDELLAYFLQLARWRIADLARRPTPQGGESQVPISSVPEPHPSAGPVTRADDRAWTREQIRSLPESFRQVLWGYYVEGRSVQEIAQGLGITTDLTKQRLARGRSQLRRRLGESP